VKMIVRFGDVSPGQSDLLLGHVLAHGFFGLFFGAEDAQESHILVGVRLYVGNCPHFLIIVLVLDVFGGKILLKDFALELDDTSSPRTAVARLMM